jgi:hypothetical protein
MSAMSDAQHLELNPMRSAIVNAGRALPAREPAAGAAARKARSGIGCAASGTVNPRGAARSDDLRVIARCLAVIVVAGSVLAFNAPELWPHLFVP